MRNRTRRTLTACGLTLAAILAGIAAPSAFASDAAERSPSRTFSFCYQDIELYPNYTGATKAVPEKDPGILVELVQLAAANAHLDVTFARYPWKRCLSLMKLGRIDSVIASFRAERKEALVYPMAGDQPDDARMIVQNGYYLYQKRADAPYWNGQKFVDPAVVIGAPLGYSITAAMKDQGLNVVEAGTTEGLLHMLAFDRLQAVAAPGAAADTLLRQNPAEYQTIVKLEAPLKMNHYFIAFSHQFFNQNPTAAAQVWQASPKVHADHFERLQAKYALPAGKAANP